SWGAATRPARVYEERQRSRGLLAAAAELAQEPDDRIEVVGHPLLHGDDAVVCDMDVFGADLRATFRDIAQPDSTLAPSPLRSIPRVERVHVEAGRLDEEARAREGGLQLLMVPDDVADVLAQEALDALVELLGAID